MAMNTLAALDQAAQQLNSLLGQQAEGQPAAAAHPSSLQPPFAAQRPPHSQGSLLSVLQSLCRGLAGSGKGAGPAGQEPISLQALLHPVAGLSSQAGSPTAAAPTTSVTQPKVEALLGTLAAGAGMALPQSGTASPAATAPPQCGGSPGGRPPAGCRGPRFTHSHQSSAFQAVPRTHPQQPQSAGADRGGGLPPVPSARQMHSDSSTASTQLLQRARSIAALLSSQMAGPALLRRSASYGELAAAGWAQGPTRINPLITQQPGLQPTSYSASTSDSEARSGKETQGPGPGSQEAPQTASDGTSLGGPGDAGAGSRLRGRKRQLQQPDSPAEMKSAFAGAAQQPAKVARQEERSPWGPPSPASPARDRQQQQWLPGLAGSPGSRQQQGSVSLAGTAALGLPRPGFFHPSPEQLAWALDIYERHYLLRQQLGASAAGAAGTLPTEALAILAAQLVCSQLRKSEWQLERSATV